MAIANYNDLKSAISSWADLDMSSVADDCIDLAEARINRRFRLRSMLTTATGTLTTGTRTLALPSGFLQAKHFRFTADANPHALRNVSPMQLSTNYRTGTGLPAWYAITDVITFDVAPDADYAYEFVYYGAFDALSDSNTTNWLITNAPNVYLMASLHEAGVYARDDELALTGMRRFEIEAKELEDSEKRSEYGGSISIRNDTFNP